MRKTLKQVVWRWTLKRLRAIVWAADEWIHARELELQETVSAKAPRKPPEEFDVRASRARERVHKAKAARLPRLRYAAGAWVRE